MGRLHDAAASGDVEEVEQSILEEDDLNSIRRDSRGNGGKFYTALHISAMHDHPKVIAKLIKAGCDIHPVDVSGRTPLHKAAFFGRIMAAKKLIQLGADIHARDDNGLTPLHAALTPSEYFGGKTVTQTKQTAGALISAGSHLHAEDDYGETPMDLIRKERLLSYFVKKGMFPDNEAKTCEKEVLQSQIKRKEEMMEKMKEELDQLRQKYSQLESSETTANNNQN